MGELYELTATDALTLMAKGSITSEDLVRSILSRIEAREAEVAAWEYLDPGYAIEQACACDRALSDGRVLGSLGGVPIGFKDIFDTADMPTSYGSRTRRDYRPVVDAACVAHARSAGAVVLGKTVTTEFTSSSPARTSNPHDLRRTAGGSSNGSAAAVADLMVPLAVGSQTGGSTVRPAAYCGVFGYKPTFGQVSLAGVHQGASTFDTVGCMARCLDDIRLLRSVLMGLPASPPPVARGAPRIALCRTPAWDEADPAARSLLEAGGTHLASAGASLTELVLPAEFADLPELAGMLMAAEYARAMAPELSQSRENFGAAVLKMIELGASVSCEAYVAGLECLDGLRNAANAMMASHDLVLTLSTGGEAPFGRDTGPATFNAVWQALGLPCLTIPVFKGPSGMPIGLQLVGRRHRDNELLNAADWIWRELSGG